jgi:hypothetical protein
MPSNSDITIAGVSVKIGEEKQIIATVAKLPTRTPIDVPILVSRSKKEGPTLLLMAGIHGDEVNGIEIIRRIISSKAYKANRGTVICIPIVNIYGFITMAREVFGGKDINRSFPGSKYGSLASQLAYFLRTEILPVIDYGLDFHTGGARINNVPQLRLDLSNPKAEALAKAFSPHFILNSDLREKSLRKEASKHAVPFIIFEGGESLRLIKSVIDMGVLGAKRVMKYLEMTDEDVEAGPKPIRLKESIWLRAKTAGIHYAMARAGKFVQKGEAIGQISSPYGDFEYIVKASKSGHIIAVNNNPVINRGDALFHLGVE